MPDDSHDKVLASVQVIDAKLAHMSTCIEQLFNTQHQSNYFLWNLQRNERNVSHHTDPHKRFLCYPLALLRL